MKPGDLVGWKHKMLMDLPGEYGLIISRLTFPHDLWPYWKVLFGERGVFQCRESDLQVINETR